MSMKIRFLAAAAVVCALVIAPVAYSAGGATVTATPAHVKEGKAVQLKVVGMNPKEKVKFVEVLPTGQKRVAYPRAGSAGVLIATIKAQEKGKHLVTFTGRSSHRTAKTHFVVR